MVTSCTAMLVLSLLLLAATQGCSGEYSDSIDRASLVFSMKEVSRALQCFGDTVREGLRFHAQNTEALKDLRSLHALPETIRALQRELEERNKVIEEKSLKVQDLEKRLVASQRRAEELEEEVKELKHVVETENPEQQQMAICMAPERVPRRLLEIKEMVQAFNENGDWGALRRGMLSVLDRSSALYSQMQEAGSVVDVGHKGHTQLAALLVCAGLPVDTDGRNGSAMLHAAAKGGHLRLLKMLLDHGADVDTRDNHGSTPLIEAGYGGHLEVVRRLVQAGANTMARKSTGETAFDFANIRGHTAIATYLDYFPH